MCDIKTKRNILCKKGIDCKRKEPILTSSWEACREKCQLQHDPPCNYFVYHYREDDDKSTWDNKCVLIEGTKKQVKSKKDTNVLKSGRCSLTLGKTNLTHVEPPVQVTRGDTITGAGPTSRTRTTTTSPGSATPTPSQVFVTCESGSSCAQTRSTGRASALTPGPAATGRPASGQTSSI